MKNAKKSSTNTIFYILLAVIGVAGVGALTYLSTRSGDATASPVDPNLPPVASAGYVTGNPNAPLEVVEFADFECPACAQFATITEPDVRARLVGTGRIRLRFIDFPLSMHRNSWNASRAAACADEQGKFWEMHDVIFANQDRWNTQSTRNPDKLLKEIARQVQLDHDKFDDCVDSKRTQAKIQAHLRIAEQWRIPSTPTFIIGDQQVPGALPYDTFKGHVDAAIAKGAQGPKFGADSARPAGVLGDTAKGAAPGDTGSAAPRR